MAMILEDGARVGVLGGGPAGSLFTYFLLTFAQRMEVALTVDVYDPRDFTRPGPQSCNMCAGIVSESLVQALAIDGIELPPSVVQRGIDSYVFHTDGQSVRLDTPLHEKRIASVHRGGGPRDAKELRWGGLDGHLLSLAQGLGARHVPARVREVGWDEGRPQVRLDDTSQTYDLLVGATGVNSSAWLLYESLGIKGSRPKTTRAYVTELHLGYEMVSHHFGSSMHTFLLDIPRLNMAAIIPKGDFVTVCLLGEDVDDKTVNAFLGSPAVRGCFPGTWQPSHGVCHCSPKISVRDASRPFADRIVLVGDCGVSRLYKDGIGAAYRAAKAAARTAIFAGVSARDFERHYLPACRTMARDNRFGLLMFSVIHQIQHVRPVLAGTIAMARHEQTRSGAARRMSTILWDMFTGSAPYRDCFVRTLDPRFIAGLLWESAMAFGRGEAAGAMEKVMRYGSGDSG